MPIHARMLRALTAVAVLAAALARPAAASAQAITYRLTGSLRSSDSAPETPFTLNLLADASTVEALPPNPPFFPDPYDANAGTSGVFALAGLPAFTATAFTISNGIAALGQTALFVNFLTPGASFQFALFGNDVGAYDLRTATGPTAVNVGVGVGGDPFLSGTGSFQAFPGNVVPPPPVSTVPEPASVALLGAGLGAVALARRRRARA